ncbi:MAG: hypothetical protein HGA84_08590 [Syntrophobacteraceae bacterium]|nr:hypothetical protein [Syntrophobacteraceae bacterium]
MLTTVIAGHLRLPERFRASPLVSLGTRVRVRLNLEPLSRDHLMDYLEHGDRTDIQKLESSACVSPFHTPTKSIGYLKKQRAVLNNAHSFCLEWFC